MIFNYLQKEIGHPIRAAKVQKSFGMVRIEMFCSKKLCRLPKRPIFAAQINHQ